MSTKNTLIRSISERINECNKVTRTKVLKLLMDNGITIQEKAEGCSIKYSNIKKCVLEQIVSLINNYEVSLATL